MPKEDGMGHNEGGSGGGQQFSSADGRANERGRTLTIKPGETVEPTENIDKLISTVNAAGSAAGATEPFKDGAKPLLEKGAKGLEKIKAGLESFGRAKETGETLGEATNSAREASEAEDKRTEPRTGGQLPDTLERGPSNASSPGGSRYVIRRKEGVITSFDLKPVVR